MEWELIQEDEKPMRRRWKTEDGSAVVSMGERNDGTYVIEEIQYASDGTYETAITTNAEIVGSEGDAYSVAESMREHVEDSGGIAVLATEKWKEYVQFYCVEPDNMPESVPQSMSPKQLVEAIDNEEFDHDVDAEESFDPDEDPDGVLQVSVYPRHESEVSVVTGDQNE